MSTVRSLRLDNGAWLLALPTPRPAAGYRGVVAIQLWIAAGSAGERASEHGCAHLFEHMVFKPHVDARGQIRDLAGVIERLGGDVNAFTSHDETVFYATVPADAFADVAEVLLDAVFGHRFDAEQLAREQDVVVEEIRQYADDPSARSVQQMMSDLYGEHAYARPVLGEEHEVRSLTPARLRAWGERQHRGAGVVMVVVGPVRPRAIEAVAKRWLGPLPAAQRTAKLARPRRPTAPRVRVLREDVQEVYVRIGWTGGVGHDDDAVALDLAAVALGQGESSRLALGVRRRARLVSDAYASYMAGQAGGTFMISAQADAPDVEAATRALLDAVARVREQPLADHELARAHALLRSSLIYRSETVQGQAHAIGYFASSTGKLDAEAEYFARLDALTPARVQAACARHLGFEHAAVTILVPREQLDARAARGLARRLTRPHTPIERAAAQADAVSMQPRRRKVKSRVAELLTAPTRDEHGIWSARHRSGLRILARPDASVPMAAGWLVWPGGLRLESARDAGLSSLTAALLTRGTAARDGDTLAREIEGYAAVLDGFSGHNSIGLQTECLSEHLSTVLARCFECALEPRFADHELDEARRIVLADLEADADDPGHLAYRSMLAALYGKHPHGRDLRGTPATLARFGRAKLTRNWAEHYPIGRAVLALCGDIELDRVLEEIGSMLAGRVAGRRPAKMPAWPGHAPRWRTRACERTLEREREQGHCVIGFPGLRLGEPEGAALDVLCTVLGGQAGRLFEALREREGLVYQVGANSSEHLDAGHVVFYAAASQDKLDAARAAIEGELARLVEVPIGADELARAKTYLIGQFESSLQRRSRVASRMVFGEVYGLGAAYFSSYPERVAAVECGHVHALARRLLNPRRQVTVLVRCP